MIVSASYRTDIPAFYGEWFQNRLRAGYCLVANPYGGAEARVSLLPEDVHGFVFWTKNLGPFLKCLPEVRERCIPFVVQYSINGYPRELETSVVDAARSVEHMRLLHGEYGPRVPVWRYDTIVTTALTDAAFHLANFERLARSLSGVTDEVVVSFAQIYKKTKRNMDASLIAWTDPPAEEKHDLLGRLAACARSYGMTLSVCGQRELLAPGIADARCIDVSRLSDVAGKPLGVSPRGHRAGCGCAQSRDIGAYDTCPHGCIYCYAVQNHRKARDRYRLHDPAADSLRATNQ